MRLTTRWIAFLLLATGIGLGYAQLTDFGTATRSVGTNDIAQFSQSGDTTFPDGLNYFTDNSAPAEPSSGVNDIFQLLPTASSVSLFPHLIFL